MEHLNLLDFRPYDIKDELIRLGNPDGDGGYIINRQLLRDITTVFSYGIGEDISFELDITKDKKIYLFDHTIESISGIQSNMIWCKEGLAKDKIDQCNSFNNHMVINECENDKILLKMDAEGAEWEYLLNNDVPKNVYGMVIEFHYLYAYENAMLRILEKLNKDYTLIHSHFNNFGGFMYGLPQVPELTFIKKDIYKDIIQELTFDIFPKKIDRPCNNKIPEGYLIDYSTFDNG